MDEATLNPSSGSGVAPTQMGSAIGTPAFMSPEQAAGRLELLGPASDVYSLGATLYCLLSGKAPFSETDVPTTLRKVQRGDFLPPRQVKRDIPAELESICLRAMAHNASDRYPTPSSLATDVERWLGDEPVQAHVDSAWAQGRRWLRRHPTLATSSAITALLGIASLAVVSVVVSAKNHDLVSAYASERAARNEANVKRIEAEELRERERLAKELSNTHRDLAERLALESRQRLKRLAIATAENMLDRGDNAQALLWALRAWELDRDDQSDAAHRVRLGAIVQSLPAIEAAVFHAERVIDFVFSPDGSRVASRTDGPNVYVWNYRHSQMAFEPLRHGALVRCVTYSRDGRWLATATGEPAARIWNAQTGARATELVHPQGARWVAFTPDSTRVATCGADKQVRFWNVATGVEETGGWSTEYEGEFLAFSGDGTQLVVCERNERATLWSVADQKRVGDPLQQSLMTPSELDAYYRWPSFSPDGRRLATGTHEGAFIWDTATGREVRAYREPASNPSLRVVHELYFGPDSNELLVMRGNSLSSVLDVGSGEVTGLSHPREAARGCISPDGSRIATQSTGGLIHLWDRSDGKLIWNARCGDQATRLAFSSDGKLLGVASWDGTVRFYNTEPVKTGRAWELNCGVAHRAAVIDQEGVHRFSPDGTIEVVYKKSPVGEVRRRGGGALFRIGDPAGMPIETATFSEDGRRLIELCGDADSHLVRVWDVATQRLIASIGPTHPNRSFTSTWISVDAAASRIAARDSHGILGVFDLARQRYVLGPVENKPLTVGTFHHYHPDLIDNLAISRDGSLVAASTASDGSIAFWDVDESLIVAHQIVHRGWANSLHFSPDGTKLLLCSSDTIARIISTRTGHQVGPSLRHHGFVRHGDWHADGRRILTLSSKGDLLVWDSVTGEALMRLPGMNVSRRAWFSAARDSIVCHPSESANYVEIEIPSVTLSIDRARDVSALLTGQSIDEYDGIGFIEPTLFRSHADRFRDAFVAFRNREAL
jgi:WD40 repeat protein